MAEIKPRKGYSIAANLSGYGPFIYCQCCEAIVNAPIEKGGFGCANCPDGCDFVPLQKGKKQ